MIPEGVPGHALPEHLPTHARGLYESVRTRSRITADPLLERSPAAAPEPPAVTRYARTFPRRTFLFAVLFAKAATLNVERAHALEQCRPLPLAHRAGRRPALGQPGARSAEREDAHPRLDVSRTGHPIHRKSEVANPSGPLTERHCP